jgi:type I restriction enzyme S subunit
MDYRTIPKYWVVKQLCEVGEIVSGGTPSTKIPEYWGGDIFWITPADLSGFTRRSIYQGKRTISESGLKNSSTRLIPEGSVLFSSRAPIGYVAIAGNKVCTNQGFKSIIPNTSITSEYLYYFLYASKQSIKDIASGTTFKEISLDAFSQLQIPLPPLPEQRSIVSKIDQLFSELDKGVESLKTARQQLKLYRQSVLKAAFEGRLTRDEGHGTWDEVAVDTKGAGITKTGLPEGWRWVRLEDLVVRISDGPFGSNLKTSDYVERGVRVIRLENIGIMEFRNEYKSYVTEKKYDQLKKHTVEKGDIIFSSFISEEIRNVILPQYIEYAVNKADCFLVRCNEKMVNKRFLSYFFSSQSMKNQLLLKIHGATRPRINTTQLKSAQIPYPPLIMQNEIVQCIESRFSVADKLEESVNQSLQQAEALRQSILKRAFEGRLV